MKRVYITGAAGLLGANLSYLMRDRFFLFGSDRNRIHIPGLALTVMNYLQPEVLERDIRVAQPDCVIHCTAYSDVDGCEQNPHLARRMNVELTERTARVCREIGARMIYISSDAVYCGTGGRPSSEEDPPEPCNVYAYTKLAGEKVAGDDSLILRTNFLGYNARIRTSFFEWMINSLRRGDTLHLFRDISFSPMTINRLSEVIALCVERPICGIYNAACDGSVTKLWFGQRTQQTFGFLDANITESMIGQAHFLAKRSENMGLDNSKLKEALGLSIGSAEDTIRALKALYDAGYPQELRASALSPQNDDR